MASRKHQERAKARRIELYIDENVKDAIRDLSDEYGVSQSQLYQYFAVMGMNNVQAALTVLPRYLEDSKAPMWEKRINFERLYRDLGIDG